MPDELSPQRWAVYCVKVYVDGQVRHTFGAGDVEDLRLGLRGWLALLLLRAGGGFVQVQCLNTVSQQWVDPSLPDPDADTPVRWGKEWGGMLNVELRFTVGLGDRV